MPRAFPHFWRSDWFLAAAYSAAFALVEYKMLLVIA